MVQKTQIPIFENKFRLTSVTKITIPHPASEAMLSLTTTDVQENSIVVTTSSERRIRPARWELRREASAVSLMMILQSSHRSLCFSPLEVR